MGIQVGDAAFECIVMTDADTPREQLDAEAEAIDHIFVARDAEFGFGDDIIEEYPSIRDPKNSRFLLDPVGHIARRVTEVEIERDVAIGRIVVLATLGQPLLEPLSKAGYAADRIDMPAGPGEIYAFTLDFSFTKKPVVTLFCDAFDYPREKRRPTFVLKLLDSNGAICGGICGSIHERDGQRFAYIATLSVKAGLPPTTGTRLAEMMISFLQQKAVISVDLITQTAGRFYEKLGFRTTLRLVEGFRTRVESDGRRCSEDLLTLNMKLMNG